MEYNVSLKNLPERRVASVRMTLPNYDCEGTLWNVLMSEAESLHIQPDNPCYCSAIFHDAEFKESDVDVEVQKTVRGAYPDTAHVRFKVAPPVTFASAAYTGPYSRIGEVMAAVAAWIQANGYTYDGLSFNIYHIDPFWGRRRRIRSFLQTAHRFRFDLKDRVAPVEMIAQLFRQRDGGQVLRVPAWI